MNIGESVDARFKAIQDEQAVNVIAKELTNTRNIRIMTELTPLERRIMMQICAYEEEFRTEGLTDCADLVHQVVEDYCIFGASVKRKREGALGDMFHSVWNKVQQKETIIGGPQK